MDQEEKKEELFSEVLRLKDAGKTQEDIMGRFPEHKNEISELFQAVDRLSSARNDIIPDKAALGRMLSSFPVTGMARDRSFHGNQESKGRSLFANPFFQIHEFMSTQMKVIVSLLALVVVGGFVLYMNYGSIREESPSPVSSGMPVPGSEGAGVTERIATTESTGNPDDIVNDILASIAAENQLLDDANADAGLVTSDSAAISEFGQLTYE